MLMIIIGDGFIPQLERFASKYAYSKLNVGVLQTVLGTMSEKAMNPTGNTFMFIVNERLWSQIQFSLGSYLQDYKVDGAHLWSRDAQKYVKVGATFNAYEYGGNSIAA